MKVDPNMYIKKLKDRIGKDYIYRLKNNKFKNKLNWKPQTDLNTGILETLRWIKQDYKNFKYSDLNYKHIK